MGSEPALENAEQCDLPWFPGAKEQRIILLMGRDLFTVIYIPAEKSNESNE